MLSEVFVAGLSSWSSIIAWTATVFCWCMVGYSIYMYRRTQKRSSESWDRMFADLRQQQDRNLKELTELLAARRNLEEKAWRVMQLRMYLLNEMEKRNIPLPADFEEDTTVH